MTIKEQIKDHYKKQKFARITRTVAEDWDLTSRGFIVDFSKDFIVLQETDDFALNGFCILPKKQIKKIRYNNFDRYYDKIMAWENEKSQIGLKTEVDLSSWKSIFKTFQNKKMTVIVECEDPDIETFTIGSVTDVTDKSVSIRYFDAAGFLDEKPTKVRFKRITSVSFDTRYADIFAKYTRKRKKKK